MPAKTTKRKKRKSSFDPNAAALPGSGIFGLNCTPEEAAVHLIPVPFDATTSYRKGAAKGPASILEASHQVDVFDLETGEPWEAGIYLYPEESEIRTLNRRASEFAEPIIKRGGRIPRDDAQLLEWQRRVNQAGARVNTIVRKLTEKALASGKLVGVVGGDHSTPFGAIAAFAKRYPRMGILHIDAHADLRKAFEGFSWSHASIMYNVVKKIPSVRSIVQVGIRDFCKEEAKMIEESGGRITTFFDREIARQLLEGVSFGTIAHSIVRNLPSEVYISFDIDGLDPTLCPHTGTPVPGGLSFNQAVQLIAEVAESGRTIVGFDLNEVAPGPEGDEWDANVGARMLYKLIGYALKSRENRR